MFLQKYFFPYPQNLWLWHITEPRGVKVGAQLTLRYGVSLEHVGRTSGILRVLTDGTESQKRVWSGVVCVVWYAVYVVCGVLYGMMWYGLWCVVWHGVVWGMVWCVVWYGVVWYDVTWYACESCSGLFAVDFLLQNCKTDVHCLKEQYLSSCFIVLIGN